MVQRVPGGSISLVVEGLVETENMDRVIVEVRLQTRIDLPKFANARVGSLYLFKA
jgi:hypothetical protein